MSSISASTEQPNNVSSFNMSQYRKSLNTMLIVLFTTLLLYLLYFSSAVTYILKNGEYFDEKSYSILSYKMLSISELVVATNSTMNPLLYLWRMQDLREAVKTTVKRILRQDHSVQDEQE
jgi:Na+/alanine symporter